MKRVFKRESSALDSNNNLVLSVFIILDMYQKISNRKTLKAYYIISDSFCFSNSKSLYFKTMSNIDFISYKSGCFSNVALLISIKTL